MKAFFYSGLLLCAIVVANVLLWMSASAKEAAFDQAKALYLSYFPGFLSNANVLTFMSIVLCCLSIYLLIRSQYQLSSIYRGISVLFTIVNGVLISWYLFTLM
ncbi:hypothetical protein [Spirosoma sp. KUDC1026]|uniref:hypothetical protein n=1 Tax=Spirosoma sp. KUDC1026 TaxID=2745947 RepID=UPI00159BEFAB|nr:hypothetical protein [Spirosoma sp. KUDC1026]QKZ12711.1 hypothetical protein HU175_08715 [Spirosoma sp. KUDC1026]